MEEKIDVKLKKMGNKEKALLVGALYRQSLLQCGLSPDAHVYDLKKDFFVYGRDGAPMRFLKKVRDYFYSLNLLDRRYFIYECLEVGRYYPFWYLTFAGPKEFSKKRNQFYNSVAEEFYEEA